MKKKSIYAIGLASGIILGSALTAIASQYVQALLNQEIKVSLNGQVQSFKDATTGEVMYPLTYNNRTYLPLRNVAELSGLDVDYDNDTKTAILNNDYESIMKNIIKSQKNVADNFVAMKKIELGDSGYFYCYKTAENMKIYDSNGNEVNCLKEGYISGPSDLFQNENGEIFYTVDDENGQLHKYKLDINQGMPYSFEIKDEAHINNGVTHGFYTLNEHNGATYLNNPETPLSNEGYGILLGKNNLFESRFGMGDSIVGTYSIENGKLNCNGVFHRMQEGGQALTECNVVYVFEILNNNTLKLLEIKTTVEKISDYGFEKGMTYSLDSSINDIKILLEGETYIQPN